MTDRTDEQKHIIETTNALEMIAQALPHSGILPDDPTELRKRILMWSFLLEEIPSEMMLKSARKAITDRLSFIPAPGNIIAAYRELAREKTPDASVAIEWVMEATRIIWREQGRSPEEQRQLVRNAVRERVHESNCSNEYVKTIADFAMDWSYRISNASEGDTTFRAQARDTLAGRIDITKSWISSRGQDSVAINARVDRILGGSGEQRVIDG